jgi:hypothetical protein
MGWFDFNCSHDDGASNIYSQQVEIKPRLSGTESDTRTWSLDESHVFNRFPDEKHASIAHFHIEKWQHHDANSSGGHARRLLSSKLAFSKIAKWH